MSDAEEVSKRKGHRRQWSKDHKARIVTESFVPGASIAEVARRHGINANLLFTWRKRLGMYQSAGGDEAVKILPVTLVPEVPSSVAAGSSESAGRMEIVLAGGDRVIVGPGVDAIALGRVVKALSRR
jgi:transposase